MFFAGAGAGRGFVAVAVVVWGRVGMGWGILVWIVGIRGRVVVGVAGVVGLAPARVIHAVDCGWMKGVARDRPWWISIVFGVSLVAGEAIPHLIGLFV